MANKKGDWPVKAYKNLDFLNSPHARKIRVLSEMVEPEVRLRKYRVRDTVVFFGSSRTVSPEEAKRNLKAVEGEIKGKKNVTGREKAKLQTARQALKMSVYYEAAAQLSEKLTRWFKKMEGKGNRFIVCSGGGPGIMEAASKGAHDAGGRSVGLNISIRTEQFPNEFLPRELSFEFHYFFIRKFWFFYLAKALAIFPGGFGTMDELFELLTLIQTKKSRKYMPIVLFGSEYWNKVIDFEAMVEWGTISREDLDLFRVFDDVDKAFEYLKGELTEHYL